MKNLKTFESFGQYDKLVDYEKNPMLRGYIECALFADLPEEHIGEFGSEDINQDSLIDAYKDVNNFSKKAYRYLKNMDKEMLNNVGMDFWYTRNGHGTGFFDRESYYGVEVASKLEEIAKAFPEKNVFVESDEFYIN